MSNMRPFGYTDTLTRREASTTSIVGCQHYKLLPKPWKRLYYTHWTGLRKTFKGEPEWTMAFQEYSRQLVLEYVLWRMQLTTETAVIRFKDSAKWRQLLEKAVKIEDRKRNDTRNSLIVEAINDSITECIPDIALQELTKDTIYRHLEALFNPKEEDSGGSK